MMMMMMMMMMMLIMLNNDINAATNNTKHAYRIMSNTNNTITLDKSFSMLRTNLSNIFIAKGNGTGMKLQYIKDTTNFQSNILKIIDQGVGYKNYDELEIIDNDTDNRKVKFELLKSKF